jgi:hypothetical protein
LSAAEKWWVGAEKRLSATEKWDVGAEKRSGRTEKWEVDTEKCLSGAEKCEVVFSHAFFRKTDSKSRSTKSFHNLALIEIQVQHAPGFLSD